jgi:hypothetical protein
MTTIQGALNDFGVLHPQGLIGMSLVDGMNRDMSLQCMRGGFHFDVMKCMSGHLALWTLRMSSQCIEWIQRSDTILARRRETTSNPQVQNGRWHAQTVDDPGTVLKILILVCRKASLLIA